MFFLRFEVLYFLIISASKKAFQIEKTLKFAGAVVQFDAKN